MTLRVCIAGATGWTGSAVAAAVAAAPELALVGAVARQAAGTALHGVTVRASVAEALAAPTDVLVDYTGPQAVKAHALTALARGVRVVIGTSGLSAGDYAEIDRAARAAGLGVIASGNFSITAALLQRFALIAAQHVADVEVVDYAGESKPDQPSGTARELAERLAAARKGSPSALALDRTVGPREARGADLGGVRVHSLRLPGFVISCEALFGLPDERLSIRHDAGGGAQPYVAGTLLAVRRVGGVSGVVRGLDTLLFGPWTG